MAASPEIAARVVSHCPTTDPAVARSLLARFGDDYLNRFDPQTIAGHVCALAALARENPAELLVRQEAGARISCAVLAFDHPFGFSSITGTLAGSGFAIESS